MKRAILFIALILSLALPANAAIKGEEVDYQQGDVTLKGYLAYDDSIEGKRPGILVVHEWWGHNFYARKRAKMLAELGYVALAVDMYGDGKTADHPDTAGEFSSAVSSQMSTVGKARFLAALDVLKNNPMVDDTKLAAIGYCFGGGVVLHMARYGINLNGVVSFHGSLGTETLAEPGAVKARILVYSGADDPFVPPEQVEAFKAEMDNAGADYTFHSLPGAVHSFSNPEADEYAAKFGMPIAYNAEADRTSWEGMKAFFKEIFE